MAFALVLRAAPAAEIHDAVESNNVERVKELLSSDAKLVNATTSGGTTPLHLASAMDSAELVKLMLEKGADVNAKTAKGYSPLHWAAHMNATNVAPLLLAAGAKLTAQTADLFTPLQLAVRENKRGMVKILTTAQGGAYSEKFLAPTFEEGQQALDLGDLDKAYVIFTRLVRDDPGNMKVRFAYGMVCYALKDYSRAQLAFDAVLQKDPQNDRARFELARTYFARNEMDLARLEFQKILDKNPSEGIRKQVVAYLSQTGSGKKWMFFGRVDAGFVNDDNVNVGPSSRRITISPITYGTLYIDTLDIQESSQPLSSQGYFGSVSFSSSYDLGGQGDWVMSADGAFYQNWLSDAEANESQYATLAVGMRKGWQSGMLQSPLTFSHITYGGDSLMDIYGVAPVVLYSHPGMRDWQWITFAGAEMRDYTSLDDRDSVYLSAGETVRHFFGGGRYSVAMGLSLFSEDADAAIYSNKGTIWTFAMDFSLPYDSAAYFRIRESKSDYNERETLAPEIRKDTQRQYTVGIGKRIYKGLAVDVNHQYTDNTSSFPLYQYDRNVTSVSMSYTF